MAPWQNQDNPFFLLGDIRSMGLRGKYLAEAKPSARAT